MGVEVAGESPSLTGEFIGETHRVLEHTQTHPPGNQHQKGPICLWVAGKVTESHLRAQLVALFPLVPLPHIYYHNAVTWVAPPWQIPKGSDFQEVQEAQSPKKVEPMEAHTKTHHNYITQN